MPPLGLHTVVAKDIADRLGHGLLDRERGALYLGSTAPDIRVITRWDRRQTHFFDLDNFDEQSGVEGLFRAYPDLARPERLSPKTASFVAGYITHLVMDETWITQIYRPFFGERSPMGGRPWANIMDRAVQWSLDLRGRGDRELIKHIVAELARDELALQVGFLDEETLRRWHHLVRELLEQPPTWDRFGRIASRYLKDAGIETAEALADFLRLLPEVAEEAVRYLTWERVQAFLDDSVSQGLEAVRRYLCV
jgi:hypothetical protein